MRTLFHELTNRFRYHGGELTIEQYEQTVRKHCSLFEDPDTIMLLLKASGYPIEEQIDGYRNPTFFTPYRDQRYCVIDIETNGSKPGTSQVIEIGAVMIKKGEIIDRLETFVECAYLPEHIIKITGIEPEDLIGAPSRKEALTRLRIFMQDAIFVAHNASFDYTFLDASFERFGLGSIGNRRLCTIDLARRTFKSERYGLAYLSTLFESGDHIHHRAYSDALLASKVMLKSFETVPEHVVTTDDLLQFSATSHNEQKRRKAKAKAAKNA